MDANTLSNLEAEENRLYHLERVFKGFEGLRLDLDYSRRKVLIPLLSFDALMVDSQKLRDEISEASLTIKRAKQEWEFAEATLSIYDVEAHQIYEFLKKEALPNHLSNNHPKGRAALEQIQNRLFKDWEAAQRNLDEYRRSDREYGGGFDPLLSQLQSDISKKDKLRQEKSKIVKIARQEWDMVTAVVKELNLTAAEYSQKIHGCLALLRSPAKMVT